MMSVRQADFLAIASPAASPIEARPARLLPSDSRTGLLSARGITIFLVACVIGGLGPFVAIQALFSATSAGVSRSSRALPPSEPVRPALTVPWPHEVLPCGPVRPVPAFARNDSHRR
jgi:hypothetical protein